MSESKDVIAWRKRTKKRIVEAFGGGCGICGYNKCNDSLDLHHLNPLEKEFSLGGARATCIGWSKLVVELRKCVLVCRNCHGEIHANISIVPDNILRFDEKFADYKTLEKLDEELQLNDNCPVCGKRKLKKLKTCSVVCGFKNVTLDWSKVDLVDLLESKKLSLRAVGSYLGVSACTVRKRYLKIKK